MWTNIQYKKEKDKNKDWHKDKIIEIYKNVTWITIHRKLIWMVLFMGHSFN
jgi:hypothetical protein